MYFHFQYIKKFSGLPCDILQSFRNFEAVFNHTQKLRNGTDHVEYISFGLNESIIPFRYTANWRRSISTEEIKPFFLRPPDISRPLQSDGSIKDDKGKTWFTGLITNKM